MPLAHLSHRYTPDAALSDGHTQHAVVQPRIFMSMILEVIPSNMIDAPSDRSTVLQQPLPTISTHHYLPY